jgi:RHS repeat-associated protein
LAAIYVQNAGLDTLYYAHTDYQGSLTALSLANGTVVERYAYDPWGNRRNPTNWTQADTRTSFIFNRGYTMHEHLPEFKLINMNGRVYDPLTSMFLSPDPYLQAPGDWLNYNQYTYCYNNPLKFTDPSGEIVWFIPVIIGAVVGAYTGASIQSGTAAFWDWKPDAWKGAIAGAIVGATLGYGVSGAIGASGMTTMVNGASVATKAAGITSSMLNSGTINIAMNAIGGGGWDGAWKAGVAGLASGAWTATGGLGMVKGFGATSDIGKLAGKLGYQMIGTAGSSIGNNWARGENPFSKVTVGVGPVNLTLGKGQKLLQWQNNIGNIATNAFGLSNLAFGGKVNFDWKNLSLNYTGGIIDKFYDPQNWYSGFGAHSVIGNSNLFSSGWDGYPHELHHLWQSRSMGDMFLLNYGLQGIGAMLMGGSFLNKYNYFEQQAYERYWW